MNMPTEFKLPPHAAEVMTIFGFPYGADMGGELWWRTEPDGTIYLAAMCNDTFDYATADCERIEEEDMPLLRQCLDELRRIDCEEHLAELFVARKRNRRPLRAHRSNELQALFPEGR
jgi:hypothetical protein